MDLENTDNKGKILRTLRRIAREATIFTLLGPIAVTLGYLIVQTYNAPSAAPHTKAEVCPNGASVSTQQKQRSSDMGGWEVVDWIGQQKTLPCLIGVQVGDRFQADDPMFDGLHTIRFKQDMYIQGYDGTWIRFPNGEETPTNQIERVVNHISLSDYVHPKDGLLAGVVFGWPFGFAVWLAYRILRFAIKG